MKNNTLLLGQDFFKDDVSFFMNKVPGTVAGTTHSHDFIEIAYVASGTAIHHLDNKQYEVTKGDLFIINNHTNHYFQPTSNNADDFSNYNCLFWPTFLDETLRSDIEFDQIARYWLYHSFLEEDITHSRIQFKGQNAIKIEKILEDMYIEFTLKENGYKGMLRAYILQLFYLIFRTYEKNNSYDPSTIGRQNEMVDDIIHYLNTHYDMPIQLQDLSDQVFTSKSTLCRTFKECTGMTIKEYIQKTRINNACEYLLTTSNKVVDIANTVGYSDLKHFNKVFKRITGLTPIGYRKSKTHTP